MVCKTNRQRNRAISRKGHRILRSLAVVDYLHYTLNQQVKRTHRVLKTPTVRLSEGFRDFHQPGGQATMPRQPLISACFPARMLGRDKRLPCCCFRCNWCGLRHRLLSRTTSCGCRTWRRVRAGSAGREVGSTAVACSGALGGEARTTRLRPNSLPRYIA